MFSLMMLSLAAHAATHRAARRLGQGGAVLCVFLPCFSALVTVLFGAFSYYRSAEEWGAGTLYNGLPIAVAEAVGLTGLAFLPLLHSPESDDIYSIGLVRKSYVNKLTPGRSLISPLVAVLTFATLPAVFRHFSFLADSDIHVDSRMDLSDPNILGAPCSAVTGAASLSSYVDSPFYAALLGLVFFFPLLDLSASSERKSQCSKIDAALSQSLCLALVMFVVRVTATHPWFTPSAHQHHPPCLCPQAFPLSYDAALHSSIAVLTFFLAAARATTQFCSGACVMSSIDNAQVVLCTLQAACRLTTLPQTCLYATPLLPSGHCVVFRDSDRAGPRQHAGAPFQRIRPLPGRIALDGRKLGVGPRGPHHVHPRIHGTAGGL